MDESKRKAPDAEASPSSEGSSTSEASSQDVVLIHGTTPDGKGLAVLRHRENRLERGLVMPIEQGKPIVGEVVTLQPRREFPLLCDVKVEYDPGKAASTEGQERRLTKGPGQVATEVYRANWERIFRPKSKFSGELN